MILASYHVVFCWKRLVSALETVVYGKPISNLVFHFKLRRYMEEALAAVPKPAPPVKISKPVQVGS